MIQDPNAGGVQGIPMGSAIPFAVLAIALSVAILMMVFGPGRHRLGPISQAALATGAIGLAIYGGMATLTVLAA
ncbi:MAG: hypothetical protein L0H26_06785 [Microlunatus sp.]|nr:hypothetical protein [Microlunatus sp.]